MCRGLHLSQVSLRRSISGRSASPSSVFIEGSRASPWIGS